MNKDEIRDSSIYNEDVVADALLNNNEHLLSTLRNRSELEQIPVNNSNEDNSSLKTVSSGHAREEINVELDKEQNVAFNKNVTQGVQANATTTDQTSAEHIGNSGNVNDSIAEEHPPESFDIAGHNNIKEHSKHMENILDPTQIELIKQSKESFTTVTLLLAPMMAKTQLAVPVYRFQSDLSLPQNCSANDDTNKTDEHYVKSANNYESWVLIAKELFEFTAAHLCVHPQSFILYRRFDYNEERQEYAEADRIRFMSILFLNSKGNETANAHYGNCTSNLAEPLWLTLWFSTVQAPSPMPLTTMTWEHKDEFTQPNASNTEHTLEKIEKNALAAANNNTNACNALIPPHLSCLQKNEVLVRCLLVRHRLPEIDPAKLATLREQLQRERDEAFYQTMQSEHHQHQQEQEQESEANDTGAKGTTAFLPNIYKTQEQMQHARENTWRITHDKVKPHKISYNEIIRNVHDLVKVAGNNSNSNDDDKNVLNLDILTRDVGVGSEIGELRVHDTHTKKETSKNSNFTSIVSVLYANSRDNNMESIKPPYLGGYRAKHNPSQRYLHASTQLFMKELNYSPFARNSGKIANSTHAHTQSCSAVLQSQVNEESASNELFQSRKVEKVSRQTQTIGISRSMQTRREACVQTPHTELYLKTRMMGNEANSVNVIVARPYFTAAELLELRTRAVITLQQCYRQWHARRVRLSLEQAKIDEQRRAERRQAMEEELIRTHEQLRRQRRTDPRSLRDFKERQTAIATWASSEIASIHEQYRRGALSERERQAALLTVNRQELKLIQQLQARQQCMSVIRAEESFLSTLAKAASARQWGSVQVETPLTQRAAELQRLYTQLQETGACTSEENYSERLDVLLHVKWTVKEFATSAQAQQSRSTSSKTFTTSRFDSKARVATTSKMKCNESIDELCQLIDREADLLHRRRRVSAMMHLRARILFLFKEFVENPYFNPSMATFTTSAVGRLRATTLACKDAEDSTSANRYASSTTTTKY